jgi:hypothetical protein
LKMKQRIKRDKNKQNWESKWIINQRTE